MKEVIRFAGGTLPVPGSPTVVLSPGHTLGHCALHLPDRDVLLAGDALVTLDPYTGPHGPAAGRPRGDGRRASATCARSTRSRRPARRTSSPGTASRGTRASRRAVQRARDRRAAGAGLDSRAVGKVFPPVTYAVGREKVREYAHAVGETNPLHLDVEAARAAGHRDVVAPPMFAVVYCVAGDRPGALRPRGRDRLRAHGPRRAGVRLGPARGRRATRSRRSASTSSTAERGGMGFFTFETRSVNQDGERVCTGHLDQHRAGELSDGGRRQRSRT